MFTQLCNNIPNEGSVTLKVSKKGDDVVVALNRSFPNQAGLSPLLISGSINEVAEALPNALSQYRRITDISAQIDKAITTNEKTTTTKTKPAKSETTQSAPKAETEEPSDDTSLADLFNSSEEGA